MDRGATSRWINRSHFPMLSHRIPITGEAVTAYFIQPCSHEPIHVSASARIPPPPALLTRRTYTLLFSIIDLHMR